MKFRLTFLNLKSNHKIKKNNNQSVNSKLTRLSVKFNSYNLRNFKIKMFNFNIVIIIILLKVEMKNRKLKSNFNKYRQILSMMIKKNATLILQMKCLRILINWLIIPKKLLYLNKKIKNN